MYWFSLRFRFPARRKQRRVTRGLFRQKLRFRNCISENKDLGKLWYRFRLGGTGFMADAVWGINGEQQIYQWNGTAWTQIPGALASIAVGDDGQVWGIDGEQ